MLNPPDQLKQIPSSSFDYKIEKNTMENIAWVVCKGEPIFFGIC